MADPTLKFGSNDDKIYKDVSANDNYVFQINGNPVATMSRVDENALSVSGPIQTTENVKIDQATAPGTVTDKLYNVSGDLYWNGQNLSLNQDSTKIQDADTNTSVTTEDVSDTIVFTTLGQERMRINAVGGIGFGTDVNTNNVKYDFRDGSLNIGVTSFQFVEPTGNLGLGVTNPNSQLHMERAIEFQSYPGGQPSDTSNRLYRVNTDLYWNGIPVTGSGAFLQDDAGNTTRIGTADVAETITLKTNNVERYQITSDGHIIPQTDAVYDLGVTSLRFRDLYLSGNSINMGNNVTIAAPNDDLRVNNNGAERLTLLSDGKVGIGSTVPTEQLDVSGDALLQGGTLNLVDTNNRIDVQSNEMRFDTNGSQQAVITSAGDVGFGVPAPTTKLDIDGSMNISTGNQISMNSIKVIDEFSLGLGVTNTNIQQAGTLNDLTVGAGDVIVDTDTFVVDATNDRVGINNANPDEALEVSGNMKFSNSGDEIRNDDDSLRLSKTTIGSDVVNSSLTSVGTLTSLSVSGPTSLTGGDVTIGQNLTVTGDLNVNGTTFQIDTEQITVSDPMIKLAANNVADTLDIGFYGLYQDTGVSKYVGMIKRASEDKMYLFDGTVSDPGPEVASELSHSYATFDFGNDRVGLGFGVTAPTQSLEVGGNALLQGGELNLVDTNEKIASDGSEMTFTVGGTQRAVIDASGNVGIATATADERLHINGIVKLEDAVAPGVTANKLYSVGGDLFWAGVEISQDSDSIQNTQDGADTTSITTAATADTIIMRTSSTERVRVESDGNVGIKTTAEANLHVYETDGAPIQSDAMIAIEKNLGNSYIQFAGIPTNDRLGLIFGYNTNELSGSVIYKNTDQNLQIRTGGDLLALSADSSQQIGIGITAPSYKLDVDGDSNITTGNDYRVAGNSVLNATTLGSGVVNSSLTSVGTLNNLTVSGNVAVDTDVLFVDTSANRVGINDATPSKALDVNGNAQIQGGEICLVDSDDKIVSDGSHMYFFVGGEQRVRFESSGNVGIGVSGAYPLDVSGDANLADGSDYRIDGNSILNETVLGSSVITSSLQSVGTLNNLGVTGALTVGNNADTLVVDVINNRVGINSATPTKALDVVGNAAIQGGEICLVDMNNKISVAANVMTIDTNGAEAARIDASGNVGIAKTPSGSYKLDVDGDAQLDAGHAYYVNGNNVLEETTLGSGVINSSLQNVGVLSDLEIAGDLLVDTNTLYVDAVNDQVMIGITTAATGSKLQVHNASGDSTLVMSNANSGATNTDGFHIVVENSGNSDVCIENKETDGDIKFALGGTNIMYMDGANDRVGIGSDSPQHKLDIIGSVAIDAGSDYRVGANSVLNATTLGSGVVNSSLTSVGSLTSLVVTGTGDIQGAATFGNNVTITGDLTVNGTTTTVDSQIVAVADPMFRLADNNPGTSLDVGFYGLVDGGVTTFSGMIKDASEDKFYIFDKSANEPGTETANVTRSFLTIDTANDRVGLGLGVTAPTKGLDVLGSARLQGGELCLVDGNNKITVAANVMSFDTNGSEAARIDASGNVGIAKTPSGTYKLDVDGDAQLDAGHSYFVNDNNVLSQTTLGSTVINSSLQNVGVQNATLDMGNQNIDNVNEIIGDTDLTLDTTTGNMVFEVANVEIARYKTDGNVGFGNVDPAQNLQVHQASSDDSILKFTNATTGALASNGFDIGLDAAEDAEIRQREAGSIKVYTSNAQRMEIDATGKVGFGTAAFTIDQDLQVEKATSGADVGAKIVNTSDTASSDAVLEIAVGGAAGGDPHIQFEIPSGSTWTLGADNSAADDFAIGLGAVGSDAKLTIATGGNVGIGSSDPTQKLDVEGSIALSAGSSIIGDGALSVVSTSADLTINSGTSGDIILQSNNGSERIRIESAGQVGIGTNAPTVDLQLEKATVGADVAFDLRNSATGDGASDAKILVQTTATGGDPHMELSTTANTWSLGVDNSDADKLKLGLGTVGTNQLMVVDLNGDVGVGTDSPNNRFSVCHGGAASRGLQDVVMEANVDGSDHAFMLLEARTATYDSGLLFYTEGNDAAIYFDESADLLKFATGADVSSDANRASNTKMTINNADGNVMIGAGATSSTLAKLYVNGNGNSSSVSYGFLNSSGGTGTNSTTTEYSIGASGRIRASEFNAISDKRIKKNLVESNYKSDLELLESVKVYDYEYIDQKYQSKPVRKGMVAQELEAVRESSVAKTSDIVMNIYKVGSVSENGKAINVDFASDDADIKAGTTVKLMIYRVEDDEGEAIEMEIESVGSNQLVLKESIDLNKYYDELFVFGTRVEDFRNINNDDVLFISVGAIKQLNNENKQLKEQLNNIMERLAALENKQ